LVLHGCAQAERESCFFQMWYTLTACAVLGLLVWIGRIQARRQPYAIPAMDLLPPLRPEGQGTTIKLRPAPGAPNTDPPTDRHESVRGSAVITRRVGRRRSTTSG
jgi:hypothetical protein